MSAQKRVGGIVLNLVKQSRAKKYGSEYQYGDRYYANINLDNLAKPHSRGVREA